MFSEFGFVGFSSLLVLLSPSLFFFFCTVFEFASSLSDVWREDLFPLLGSTFGLGENFLGVIVEIPMVKSGVLKLSDRIDAFVRPKRNSEGSGFRSANVNLEESGVLKASGMESMKVEMEFLNLRSSEKSWNCTSNQPERKNIMLKRMSEMAKILEFHCVR